METEMVKTLHDEIEKNQEHPKKQRRKDERMTPEKLYPSSRDKRTKSCSERIRKKPSSTFSSITTPNRSHFSLTSLWLWYFFIASKVSWASDEKPLEFEDIVDKRTYDKMRPPKPEGRATTVSFHVTVMSLDTIDEGSMTYAADVFFAQEWKDHRLRLPNNMTHEYRLLPVEWLHLIWRPDSFFKNAKKVTFQTMTIPNHYLWLYQDKTILYMVKLTLLLSCAMHFENYPHDEQICRLSMESLSHTTDDLVFIWLPEEKTPLSVGTDIELPQLELVSNITGDCTSVYTTGNFTCLEVIFKFQRRLGYYLFHTYIPTCLIVMMSWISFWIKPEAVPARVTLGVTSLLTLSTQHANSQKSLPPVSYIKAIDIFMSSCTIFVFLSLIEYAFVNVTMGDISEVERKDKTQHLRNIIVTTTNNPSQLLGQPHHGGHHENPTIFNAYPSGPPPQTTLTQQALGHINPLRQQQQKHHHQHNSISGGGATNGNSNCNNVAYVQQQNMLNHLQQEQQQLQREHLQQQQHPHSHHFHHEDGTQQLLNKIFQHNQPHSSGGPPPTSNPNANSGSTTTIINRKTATTNLGGGPGGGSSAGGLTAGEMCPKHGGGGGTLSKAEAHKHEGEPRKSASTAAAAPSIVNAALAAAAPKSIGAKNDPKEVMKKRRERAICIDRVSRVLFPSTFILLNIIYWLVFSEILSAIPGFGGHDDH